LVLNDWLPTIIQAVEPFVSSEDIVKGARWLPELAQTLEEYSVGIVCLTPHNLDSRWLNFEAGALSKAINEAKVIPFLLGLRAIDVQGPLAQFQATAYAYEDFQRMLLDINELIPPPRPDGATVRRTFERFWPDTQASLDPLLEEAIGPDGGQEQEEFDLAEILQEIRDGIRSQQNLLAARLPSLDPSSVQISRDDLRSLLMSWALIEDHFRRQEDPKVVPDSVWDALALLRGKLSSIDGDNRQRRTAEVINLHTLSAFKELFLDLADSNEGWRKFLLERALNANDEEIEGDDDGEAIQEAR
jgi:hypothetical protein